MSQHRQIRDRLLSDIASGRLPFGSRLTIDDLARSYGASHMPVREALRELQGAGLLEDGPGRSARLRRITPAFIENLFSTRVALQSMLARQAAQRFTRDRLDTLLRIEAALEGSLAAADHAGVLAHNRQFHAVINAVANNPEAEAVIARHWLLISALWQRLGYGPERFAAIVSDHQHLMTALERNDADAAGILMGAHVVKTKFELLARLHAVGPEAALEGRDTRRDDHHAAA